MMVAGVLSSFNEAVARPSFFFASEHSVTIVTQMFLLCKSMLPLERERETPALQMHGDAQTFAK